MACYLCASCSKNLDGHPKIKVEGLIYCYYCAKRVVAAKDRSIAEKQAQELKVYEAKFEKWQNWNKNLEFALPSRNTQNVIIFGAAICCAVLSANPILFLPGLVVGLIARDFYVGSRKSDWIRSHPEPDLPSTPSNSFLRDRIELVGGVRGKQPPSGYRKNILERDGYECQTCGGQFPADELEVHHIKPQAKWGKDYSTNLVTLCWRCHRDETWFGHRHKMG